MSSFFLQIILFAGGLGVALPAWADWIQDAPANRKLIRPEPAAVVAHEPAAFFWPALEGASGYSVEWKQEGRQLTRRASRNYLVLDLPLAAGEWQWRVTASLKDKVLVSDWMAFSVTDSPESLALPPAENLRVQLMGRARPRMWPVGTEWQTLKSVLRGPRAELVTAIRTRSQRPLESSRALQQVREGQVQQFGRLGLKNELTALSRNLLDVAFMWRLSSEEVWRQRALEILARARIADTDALYTDPSDLLSPRALLWINVVSYDLLHDALPAEELQQIRGSLSRGLEWHMRTLLDEKTGLAFNPFDSQRSEILATALVASGVMLGELPAAREHFQVLLSLHQALGVTSLASDGGPTAAGAYAVWDYVEYLLPQWEMLRWCCGVNLSAQTSVRNFAKWLAVAAPPGKPGIFWGDGAETISHAEWEVVARLLAARDGAESISWYAQQLPRKNYSVLDAMAPVELSKKSGDLSGNGFVLFPQSGLAVFNAAGKEDFSLHFRSSPYLSMPHGHEDVNAFVLTHKGKLLAIDSGAYDAWGSEHYRNWYKRAFAHNSITFDGGGLVPPKQVLPLKSGETGGGGYVLGEFQWRTLAGVGRAQRYLAVADDGVVLVVDLLEDSEARQWEWNLHAMAGVLMPEGGLKFSSISSSACLELRSDHALREKVERLRSPSVKREWGMETHAHYSATADVKKSQARFVAVIDFLCRNLPAQVAWREDGGVTVGIQGKTLDFAKPKGGLSK